MWLLVLLHDLHFLHGLHVYIYLRDWAMAVVLKVLQQVRGRHFLTEVVTGVRGESEVAVNK